MNAVVLERGVSRYIPYSHHVTKEIVACSNNEYLSVIKVGGRSAIAASLAEQAEWIEQLHNVIRGQRFGEISFYSHTIRRKITEYPKSNYTQFFAKKFDDEYRSTFDESGLMINELYLTVLVHPIQDTVLGVTASLEKANAKQIKAWQEESIEKLESAVRAILAGLHRYDAEVLSVVDRGGYAFSEVNEFLAYLINGTWQQVPLTKGYINEAISFSRPIFSPYGAFGEIRATGSIKKFGMLELLDYPEEVHPGHLNNLMYSPYEFVLTQSWGSHTSHNAKRVTKRHAKLLQDSNDDSPSQLRQLDQLIDDLNKPSIGLGDHHVTLLLFGESIDDIARAMSNTTALLAEKGLIFKSLERATEAGFWAQLPGNWAWRPRPKLITSYNFLCFSSFHNQLTGKATGNPWGPAVTMLKTETGAPFFFNYHTSLEDFNEIGKRKAGNTMIIGQTGTGKTVLQAMLLTQAQKFGATAVVFDKDQGLQVLIKALRGTYFTLRLGQSTGWQPFQMEPTQQNIAFMRRLVVFLCELTGESVSTEQRKQISLAVDQMVEHIDFKDRSFSTLVTLLPNPHRKIGEPSSVHERLLAWCRGGEYGWVFDGEEDLLNLEAKEGYNPLFGFDLTEILDDKFVRAASTLYLQYRVDALHDGRRIINLIDECQHPLEDKHFQSRLQDAARTIRKKNGVLTLSTQEPEAIANNPVGSSLIQQSATLIFLPNPKANKETYTKHFGLTEEEFNLVKGLGEASRKFVIKQGANVTVAELNLSSCEEALFVFSGSSDYADIADHCIKTLGDDPKEWLPMYFEKIRNKMKEDNFNE